MECQASLAMKINLPVKGYLTMGDDVILNTWNIVKLNRDKVWLPRFDLKNKLELKIPNYNIQWKHWGHGAKSVIASLASIKHISDLNSASDKTV